jgi:RND family efflux transporter MFP subunit
VVDPSPSEPGAASPSAQPEPKPEPLHYQPPRRLKLVVVAVAALFLAVLIWGLASRAVASHQLSGATRDAGVPVVSIIAPSPPGVEAGLVLPGNVSAFYHAPVYAQVSGYLKSWNDDIGAPVQAGAVLGVIETPDLDQQLAQAKANLVTAQANERISAITARRWNLLLQKDAVAQQDADQKNADLAANIGAVQAARANVQRLEALEGFKTILAPFNGIVTQRNTDIGALITVGGQTPLFTVDDEHRLRIYVNVPQPYSGNVTAGLKATFTVPEHPSQIFTAVLTSTATAIDPTSGSLLVQFQTDNALGLLHPGEYASVHIPLPLNGHVLMLPPSALLFRDPGMEVATLGPGNHVIIKRITISRDLGKLVEISDGLSATDKVVDNPPDSLEQGDLVRIAPPVHPGSKGASASG